MAACRTNARTFAVDGCMLANSARFTRKFRTLFARLAKLLVTDVGADSTSTESDQKAEDHKDVKDSPYIRNVVMPDLLVTRNVSRHLCAGNGFLGFKLGLESLHTAYKFSFKVVIFKDKLFESLFNVAGVLLEPILVQLLFGTLILELGEYSGNQIIVAWC